uniref:Nucleoporin NUP53 n=1 Tax=Echeneis naucrates TaxID=173247 RepID=A0A665TXB4_ECHNA
NLITSLGNEPMSLGSPTSPKPTPGAQFLPGFLMGDLPAPPTPQPRSFGLSVPMMESPALPLILLFPHPRIKSGAPPVRSIHHDMMAVGTPLNAHRQVSQLLSLFPEDGHWVSLSVSPPYLVCVSQACSRCVCLTAQVDPFYSQGESLSSDDQLDQTWVTVFGFPPASASYILLQFAQYGNILKHTVRWASPGNWMHLQYQSRLQARKALSKDGKVFGDAIMVGVKPCIDKSVMDSSDVVSSPLSNSFSTSALPSTPRSAIRPLSATYRSSSSDYQVVSDRQTPRKDDSFVSKAMEYMFGW